MLEGAAVAKADKDSVSAPLTLPLSRGLASQIANTVLYCTIVMLLAQFTP